MIKKTTVKTFGDLDHTRGSAMLGDVLAMTEKTLEPTKRKKKSFVASRLGCDNCKKLSRRKCDEQLPECGSCRKKNIRCSYLDASQEFLDRIRRAHSIIADHSRLQKAGQLRFGEQDASFGKFKVVKETAMARKKPTRYAAILSADIDINSVQHGFINFQVGPLSIYRSQSRAQLGLPSTSTAPCSSLPGAIMIPRSMPLYRLTICNDFRKTYNPATVRLYEIFNDLYARHRKRFEILGLSFCTQYLNAEKSLVLFLSLICYSICVLQRKEKLYQHKPGRFSFLGRFLERHYSFAAHRLNNQFKYINEVAEGFTAEAPDHVFSRLVYTATISSMIQFGAAASYRPYNYKVAMNFFLHYQEILRMFKKSTTLLETSQGALGDGFVFFKALGYADMKEVFIPSYDPTFLDELFADFAQFKRFVVSNKHLLEQYNEAMLFFDFLKTEVVPLRNTIYVVSYPPDIISKVHSYWYKIIPCEVVLLDGNFRMSLVERVFYAFWITLGVAMDNILNHQAYLYGGGFTGLSKISITFDDSLFKELDGDLSPDGLQLKAHINYFTRLISFFSIRANIYHENIHFHQPYPDYLEKGLNRFIKRALPWIQENQITHFKNVYFKREHFPSLSYSATTSQLSEVASLFDQYKVQFKETNPPINTRIDSIIHSEDPAFELPIPFHKFNISRNGLLPLDYNPRDTSYLTNQVYGENFDTMYDYLNAFLSQFFVDRNVILGITHEEWGMSPGTPLYLDMVNLIANYTFVSQDETD